MRLGLEWTDLRRGGLRGAAVVCLITIPIALALDASSFRGPTPLSAWLALASSLAGVGVIVMLLSLIELRAYRRPSTEARRGGCAQVWIAGMLLWPLLFLQGTWTEAAMRTGSLEAGLLATGDVLASMVSSPIMVVLGGFIYAAPFAILSGARLQDRHLPLFLVVGWTAVLGSPLLCVGGWMAWVVLLILMPILHGAYGAADYLDARLARRRVGDEVSVLQAYIDAGRLSWADLWILAYVDHEPARQLLKGRAPPQINDLVPWVRRIATGKAAALVHGAAAAARLTRARWEETPTDEAGLAEREARAFAAVDRWDAFPSEETLSEAKLALADMPLGTTRRPEIQAALSALVAITTPDGGWARETIRLEAAHVATLAAQQTDDATTRQVIQSAVVSWILRDLDEAGPSPLRVAEAAADREGDVE